MYHWKRILINIKKITAREREANKKNKYIKGKGKALKVVAERHSDLAV
jgi:hypothetical protein